MLFIKMGDMKTVVLARLKAIALGQADLLRTSEEELKALEVAESYGVVLAEIASSPELDVHVRQLSALVLKQYVQCHWNEEGEQFCEPLTTVQAKQVIKRLLLGCLSSEQNKIRSTVAYAVASIAVWEWPEEWPEFIDVIIQSIRSGNQYLISGSMHVLEEFSNEVTDTQLPQIAPLLFPELFRIISEEQVYDLETRCRGVTVFETLTTLILVVSDVYPAVKDFLIPWLKQYLTVFGALLSTYGSIAELGALSLIKEILSVVTKLLSAFPKYVSNEMSSVLQPAWGILVASVAPYVANYVNGIHDVPGLEGVLFALFDFISTLVQLKKLRKVLIPALPQLLHYLINYMLITEVQLISWDDEPEKFLEDENDDLYSNSLRMSALDLVNSVGRCPTLSGPSMEGLIVAINKHLEEAGVAKQQGLQHWWKVHESCMLVIPLVAEGVASGHVQFDIHRVMTDLVIPNLMANIHPLLTGRCLWLSGKLVSHLHPDVLRQCMRQCVTGIGNDQHMLVRICAVMATHEFCSGLEGNLPLEMVPCGEGLLRGVVDLIKLDSDGIRIQVLETLTVLISVAKEIVNQESHHIVQLCTQVFVKCCNDPGVLSVLEEVYSALARQPSCQEAILNHFAPLVVKVLQHTSESGQASGMAAAVLDLWTQVILNYLSPLPLAAVEVVFPSVVSAVLSVDDSAILQSGGECTKAYLIKGVEQLGAWSANNGENGLLLTTKVILHILDPSLAEFSASFLGSLVIVLIKQVGSMLGDHLETIVRSILSKLHTVQSPTVVQSLLSVLFYLVHTQLESTLSFLEQVPDISGHSSLEYVLRLWVSRHDAFFGKWDTRLSSAGLCDLLLHYVATGDKRLVAIETEMEEVINESRGIVTRSMRKKEKVQYSRVLWPQKLLKLLIDDYQIALESATGVIGGDEWEDESEGESGDEGGDEDLFASLIGGDIGALCEMENEQSEFSDDPLMLMDWKVYLEEVLWKCCQSEKFGEFLPSLTAKEMQILSNITTKH